MLWRDSLVMYDRATRSLWSQVNGQALAGPLKGQSLNEVPSEQTTWGEWKRRYPDTLVLVKPPLRGSPYASYFDDPDRIGVRGSKNPDGRLGGKELVVGIEAKGRFAAVPLDLVEKRGAVNVEAIGVPLVVTRMASFDRRVGNQTLTFAAVAPASLRDRETGSLWLVETGEAVDGPRKGKRLQRVSAKVVYWAIWARFHPRSELIRR